MSSSGRFSRRTGRQLLGSGRSTAAGVITRRAVLGSAVLAPALAACGPAAGAETGGGSSAGPAGGMNTTPVARAAAVRIAYGSDPSQFGELHLPAGPRRAGTAVVIHGGFWRAAYGLDLGTSLAADLASRGWVAWNLEYRRVGDGGGWTATFDDIAAGIDALSGIASSGGHGPIDTTQVVAIGHSAGGHLAAWAAARPALGTGAPMAFGADSVAVTGVVSQAGVLDLTKAVSEGVGGSAVQDLLGGAPAEDADRYRIADPTQHLPLGVPVHCVHGDRDGNVPINQSSDYVTAAQAAGDVAVLHRIEGDHFTLIDVGSQAWATVVDLLPDLFG